MDETDIKVKGQLFYYYQAVDNSDQVVDFLLSQYRDDIAARAFFNKAFKQHCLPKKVAIYKSGANTFALHNLNVQLWLLGRMLKLIEELQVKYLNNIVEKSHQKVKEKIHQCLGWKSCDGATNTLAGIELWTMIKMNN